MIINKDCLEALKELPDNSIDSIVTDPPYGLSFMGKKWDYDVPSTEIWQECLRVLKPGGYLLAFSGTRTYHRMASAIEDAGFEVRDMIEWVYGSGFPKSLNIGKVVDKLQGNERIEVGDNPNTRKSHKEHVYELGLKSKAKETKGTSEWEGWGTALKPAHEPICMARKPLAEKNVAENCLKYGTGGINIDESRVETEDDISGVSSKTSIWGDGESKQVKSDGNEKGGRFPANLIHDGSEEVLELFPNESHRFFYTPKASKSERNMGLDGFEEKEGINGNKWTDQDYRRGDEKPTTKRQNFHPTVKPIKLMEYLVNLVSKEGHTVLDPFCGSGTTGIACQKLNRNFIGIERDEEYCKIAEARIESVSQNNTLFV